MSNIKLQSKAYHYTEIYEKHNNEINIAFLEIPKMP